MPPKSRLGQKSNESPNQNVAPAEVSVAKPGPDMPWSGEVTASSPVPGRCSHVSALWGGRLLNIGGWLGKGGKHSDEVEAFDFSTGNWSAVETVGEAHPGTSQAAAAEVGGALLFFGGWNGKQRINDMTMYQLEDSRWAPFTTTGEKPTPVTFHTCTVVGRRLYSFGGNTAEGQTNDMRILDLNTTEWSVAMSHGAPGKRSSHSATSLSDGYILVFGGRGGADGTTILNDVGVFDPTSNQWMLGVKVEGAPPPRYGHSAIAIGNKVVIFGGVGDKGALLDDTWVLDVEKPTQLVWSKVNTGAAPTPSGRTNHSAIETMTGMYVIGGRTDGDSVSSQIYLMDLAPIAPIPPNMGDGENSASRQDMLTPEKSPTPPTPTQ